VDESVHIIFRNCFCDPLNTFNMDILEAKVLSWIGQANEIVYNIRVPDALF
jgi:hypothetical protein